MQMRSVLVVDDSEADQFLTKRIILKHNAAAVVHQAYDGREALTLLDALEHQPEIIFVDINMPVMDGHEFLEKYAQRQAPVSVVVMLTSSEQRLDKERAGVYAFVREYLLKPLSPEDLARLTDVSPA